MAGVLRWRDLQNIAVTEDQINLLAGLTAVAADLNRLTGFNYTGAELNTAFENLSLLAAHKAQSLAHAHPVLENSLDGGTLANGTVDIQKLSFLPLTLSDDLRYTTDINNLQASISEAIEQINALYSIVLPGQANDIAESINKMVAHIEKLKDAHDATAISFGNQYSPILDTASGSQQTRLSLEDIRFVKVGDGITLQSTVFGPENAIVAGVNYNTGHVSFTSPAVGDYRIADSFVLTVKAQENVQQGIERSLRNTTDILEGRLTIVQEGADSALEIEHTGTHPYTAQFNKFFGKTQDSFNLELGSSLGITKFGIQNENERVALEVWDDGEVAANNYTLMDYNTLNDGRISKQSLSADREWTLPNRSGYIGVGDLTFTELLKVSLNQSTKTISIAPGFMTDYSGQKVSAWISMEYPCNYPGGSFNLQSKFQTDGKLLTLGNKWQVVVPFIDDNNNIGFQYGPQEALREDAIANYENFIPSAYMHLAKIIVQGDNAGGILSTSIEILEDQRPILSMGLSSAYYDEVITATNGIAAGTLVTLPLNSKAGGMQMTYQPGRGQLELYLDGVYQRVLTDYEETQGTPVGRIRLLKDVQPKSELRFRVTFKSAAVAGGIDIETLQTVYQAGPSVLLSSLYGPINLSSYDMSTLMDIAGDIVVQGVLRQTKGIEFVNSSTVPGDDTVNQLFTNTQSKLIFHQRLNGQSKDIDLLQEIENAQSANLVIVSNMTGAAIPKGRGVALHPSLTNHIVLCDTSNALSTSRLIGITAENIASGATGKIILGGSLVNSGLSIPHKSVIVVDPRNPGLLVARETVTFLPTDQYMEAGTMNGSNIIVEINTNKPKDNVWRTGIAGENLNQNTTKIVRFGLFGETRGAVYKATKADANSTQKFWAIAAVQPKLNLVAGDSLNLFTEITLAPGEPAFADEDIGLPLYLGNDGSFKSWNDIKGTYALGDAIVKIGQIEDRYKFIIKDIQMMGTAPGPM